MCARVSGTLWASAHSSFSHLRGSFLASLLGLSAFWLFAEADLALVRHFLDTENAGFYSAAGLMSRVLLFVGIATAFVAFPRFVLKRRQPADALRTLHLALAIAAAVILAMTIVIAVFRTTLIALAFGDAFGPAAALLPSLCVAMGLLALAAILTYFHIAMESRVHLAMLTGFIVVAALVATFHSEPQEVALIIASVAAAVAAVQYRAAIDLCRARDQLMAETGVRLEPASGGQTELSLVLPCRNTAQSLPNVIHSLLHELQEFESYEILIVSDGSTDDTVAVGERFSSDCVRTLQTERGNGKGSALRLGLTQARGNYVAFLDGDGDVGPEAIRPFLALMKLYEPDIVIGSKRHPLSEVYYPPLRRLASWGYHLLARVLFRINIRDTQTGVKLIRREVLSSVLPRTLERGYAFDLEFLVIARSLGFKRMFEAPIRLDYKFESQIDLGAAARIGWDTLKVFYRHYLLDLYRRTPPLRTPLSSPLVVSQTRARPMGNTSTRGLEILVVNWRDTHDPAAGGAETFVHQVARRWATHGHNVTLITSRPSGAPRTELIDGIRVKRLGRLADGSFHALVQREFMRIRGVDLVIEAVNTIPFLTPLWRSRLPRTVPLIFQRADDIWDAHYGPIVAAIGKRVERRLLRMYHYAPVLTISESARLDLARSGLSNVTVVEPGIDHPASVGHQKDIAPTFLFVGRLAANKRPDHAVEAFAEIHRELPTSRLWIVGRGPLEAKLRKATPSGVEILGFLPRDELHARMGRAHCLLVPSVREGWGLVVVEANAVRTPAVGYDVPGLRDSIRNGKTGKLVTPGDPRAMAAAALELIGDPESYSQICDAAHTWSERFSWDITAERVLAFAMRTTSDTALDAVRVPSFEGVAR
jgi:glycosyltransferase involved in cell wall biosynthesis